METLVKNVVRVFDVWELVCNSNLWFNINFLGLGTSNKTFSESEVWSSQLIFQLKQWKEEAWKSQGFNGMKPHMCGFIAQLVEHRTGIAEVTGSNPVEALTFSGFFFPAA